jgi:phosphatidate cytidylyltransferase
MKMATRKKFTDLSKRISVSIVLVALVVTLITFAMHPLVGFLIALIVAALAAIGVWEYGQLARSKDLSPAAALMVTVAVAEVFAFYVAHKWFDIPQLPVLVLALGLGLFFLNRFSRMEDALVHVAVELFGVVYVAIPLSYMLAILYPFSMREGQDGRWWLLYLLVVTKITDTGAYFFGRLCGRHRLAPVLSPKKTIEGAIAGFLCAVLFSLAMVFIGKEFAGSGFPLKLWDALWMGILIGIFGQIGDLAESLLKRDAVVKDSNTLPGLGGVLDMLDSLIFTAPILYFYLTWHPT